MLPREHAAPAPPSGPAPIGVGEENVHFKRRRWDGGGRISALWILPGATRNGWVSGELEKRVVRADG